MGCLGEEEVDLIELARELDLDSLAGSSTGIRVTQL